jgi:hypothetical protein
MEHSMSLIDTPTNLSAIVEIANARTKPKLLTLPDESGLSNFEILEVKPYTASTNDHNSIATIRVDLGFGSNALPIPEHERYSIRKVPFTRIDLKDIAEFNGLEKNENNAYVGDDLTIEALSALLAPDVAEHVTLTSINEVTSVLKAKADSIGYIGSVTFVGKSQPPEPEPPVEYPLATTGDGVKIVSISHTPNGEYLYGAVADSTVYVNVTSTASENKDIVIKQDNGGMLVEELAVRGTVKAGQVSSIAIKLIPEAGVPATVLAFGANDNVVGYRPMFQVNASESSVLSVNFTGAFQGPVQATYPRGDAPLQAEFTYAEGCISPETVVWSMEGIDDLDITYTPLNTPDNPLGPHMITISWPANVVSETTTITAVCTVNGTRWEKPIVLEVPELKSVAVGELFEGVVTAIEEGQNFGVDLEGSASITLAYIVDDQDYVPSSASMSLETVSAPDNVIIDYNSSTRKIEVVGVQFGDVAVLKATATVDGMSSSVTFNVKVISAEA